MDQRNIFIRSLGWLAALCLALGVALSSTSERVKFALHSHGRLHPWWHVVAFAALAFAAMKSSSNLLVRVLLMAALFALAFGTEYREHLLDGWPVERPDVLMDMLGLGLGALLGQVRKRRIASTA